MQRSPLYEEKAAAVRFFSGKGEKIVQNLTADGKVIQINRPCDKRKVLFYYDHSTDFEVDEEFIKQVRFTP